MKNVKYLLWFLALFNAALFILFIAVVSAAPTETAKFPSGGVLNWKGQDWYVSSGWLSPGGHEWNGNGAFIDDQDRMHLTIKKVNGVWKCTELCSQQKYLYGTFTWSIESPVYSFDKNSVVGLFTYLNDTQELDIEMSRSGISQNNNLWFSVQPYHIQGNSIGYKVPSNYINTKYILDWEPDYVRFTAKQSNGEVIADHTYTNISGIPCQPEYVLMNLWLTAPPSNEKNIELIVSDFTVTSSHQIFSEAET
jgi:endo-1,3-1,4-beta-glycanase ExoK